MTITTPDNTLHWRGKAVDWSDQALMREIVLFLFDQLERARQRESNYFNLAQAALKGVRPKCACEAEAGGVAQ